MDDPMKFCTKPNFNTPRIPFLKVYVVFECGKKLDEIQAENVHEAFKLGREKWGMRCTSAALFQKEVSPKTPERMFELKA